MPEPRYQTTTARARLAIASIAPASLVGAAILGGVIIAGWVQDQPQSVADFAWDDVFFLLVLGLPCAIFLLLVAAAWTGLHRLGWRHWSPAGALGFLAIFVPAFLWIDQGESVSLARHVGHALGASMFAAVGAAVALIAWRLAYRRV